MAESRVLGSICPGCLSRLRISSSIPVSRVSQSRFFHNTTPTLNVVKKKTNQAGAKTYGLRERRSAVINKKHREVGQLPAVGQRKLERKRIVLSNTNALAVEGMQDLSTENMADPKSQAKMIGLPGDVIDQFRAAEAFKTTQNWFMFRRPATLMREQTIQLGGLFKDSEQRESSSVIVDGPKGSGKSMMLMQAMAMAYLNKWVVINIPEAQDLTIAHSAYKLEATKEGKQSYVQTNLYAALLKRIVGSNRKVLSSLTVACEHPDWPVPLQKNMSLDRFADYGITHPIHAPLVFHELWKELTIPSDKASQPRPRLLVCADGLNHFMADTAYRAADFTQIFPDEFRLIRHFLDLAFTKNGLKSLPSGSLVMTATSGSNIPSNYTLDLMLKQLAARSQGVPSNASDYPHADPWVKTDVRVLSWFDEAIQEAEETADNAAGQSSLGKWQIWQVNGLTKPETAGLLEYYARSGLLKERITEETVGEKWTLSSGGLVSYVEKAAGRLRA